MATGVTLTSISHNYLIEVHTSTYPTLTKLIVRNNNLLRDAISGRLARDAARRVIRAAVSPLRSISSVDRIKVWNSSSNVVWSDAEEIIGESFPNNHEVRRALEGTIVSTYERQTGPENRAEMKEDLHLEIYIPLEDKDGEVFGIIELYERDAGLMAAINRNSRLFWLIIATFSLLLYGALFFVFYGSNRFNKKMISELNLTQDVTIYALAYQAELRDNETGRHIERTTRYVRLLAEELRQLPHYTNYITDAYLRDIERSAPLHDIGKVGVPDEILRKPGKLNTAEFEQIKHHPINGASTLRKASVLLGFTSFLEIAIQLAESHHEKWDGSGYPYGLAAEAIPLSGRIMAVADVYDALRCKRVYKEAFSHSRCVSIIREGSGSHFDPEVVQAFLRIEKRFEKISAKLADSKTSEGIPGSLLAG